jgi:hypothetical protein
MGDVDRPGSGLKNDLCNFLPISFIMINMADDFIPQIKPQGESSRPVFQEQVLQNADKTAAPRERRTLPRKKIILISLGVLAFFLVINFLIFLNICFKGRVLMSEAVGLKEAVSSHDLGKVKEGLKNTEKALGRFKGAYSLASWTKAVPFLGLYARDGQHFINAGMYSMKVADILVKTVEPYSDLIGFSGGKEAGSGEKTAADRIDFIVKALPQIIPSIDEIIVQSKLVKDELASVNPNRYPVKFAGRKVRSELEQVLDLINQGASLVESSKPILKEAPNLLGLDKPKTYLVIFQNDKELRPTGGFITAYSIMQVDKAKFSPVDSSDIYNLDAKYKPSVAAPQPIIDYIKGPYVLSKNLRLRDMNWSPDFKESMQLFL